MHGRCFDASYADIYLGHQSYLISSCTFGVYVRFANELYHPSEIKAMADEMMVEIAQFEVSHQGAYLGYNKLRRLEVSRCACALQAPVLLVMRPNAVLHHTSSHVSQNHIHILMRNNCSFNNTGILFTSYAIEYDAFGLL